MARPSLQEVTATLDTLIEDNTSQLVTAADVRAVITSLINAIYPASAYLVQQASKGYTANLTPQLMTYQSVAISPRVDYTASTVNGQVLRLEKGTTAFEFTADVAGGNNVTFTFTLFKDGVATLWAQSITCNGSANPQSLSFSGFDYKSTPNTVYEIRISAESNGNACTISNSVFLCLSEPVGVYT